MPATTKAPLGATTTNRKWYLDVDTSSTATPTWTGVFGIQEFKDNWNTSLQDDSDFDSNGWKSQMNTANDFALEIKIRRAVQAALATAYDPGQEKLRLASRSVGMENVVHIRWYEMEPNGPRVEAYEGYVAVGYAPDGGGMDALSTAVITLTGRGKPTLITHPATPV